MSDVKTRLHLANGSLTVERIQDVEDIIENNKRLQTIAQKSDWCRHVAAIPNIILERWMHEEQVNLLGMSEDEWGKFIRKKLNDPDWRFLRTDK